MNPTRAQKIRLAIFLLTSATILAATLIYMLGTSLLETRDEYHVILQGSSAGLQVGSQVRYNGIAVGRIEFVQLDKQDPSKIHIRFTVEGGTPITADTVATPELANVTGMKLLALSGGTSTSEKLKPGSTIPAVDDDFSLITTRVVNISNKIENLLDNLVNITDAKNSQKLEALLTNLQSIIANLDSIIVQQSINVDTTLSSVANITKQIDTTLQQLSSRQNLSNIANILQNTDKLVKNLNQRSSPEELGSTLSNINDLATNTNVTVLRLRDDLRRTMIELEKTLENMNEFSQILVDNPAALISGRSERQRTLP